MKKITKKCGICGYPSRSINTKFETMFCESCFSSYSKRIDMAQEDIRSEFVKKMAIIQERIHPEIIKQMREEIFYIRSLIPGDNNDDN